MRQHYTYNVPCTTRGMMSYLGHLFALKIYMQSTNLVIYILEYLMLYYCFILLVI